MNMISEYAKKFEEDKKILVEGILNAMPKEPIAILLCGGYGRDEGAWYINENGRIVPYNDYDLAVITDTPLSPDAYKHLRSALSKKIGIRWIDIDFYTPTALKDLKDTIHNVDLFDGSKLLWGDSMWSSNLKHPNPKKIGRFDLITLYRTRMWTLLGAWEGDFKTIEGEQARFFRNQMAKCILASCDMLLIDKKEYVSSYKERVEKILLHFSFDSLLCKWAEWAINEKLSPKNDTISKDDMIVMYSDVYKIFLNSYRASMQKEALCFLQPSKTDRYIKLHTNYYILLIKGLVKGLGLFYKKAHELFLAQNYVLQAYNGGNIIGEYLQKASDILVKYHYVNTEITDWNEARKVVSHARNNI